MLKDNITKFVEKISRKEIPGIYELKAIAIISIIAYHCGIRNEALNIVSGQAVILFFIISGFLITKELIRKHDSNNSISIKEIYLKRSTRLLPGYYFYILFVLALMLINNTKISWSHVASVVLFYSNYYYPFASSKIGYYQHLWFIAVEFQFILIYPYLFTRYYNSNFAYKLIFIIIIVWLLRAIYVHSNISEKYIYRSLETRIDELLLGCLSAIIVNSRKSLPLLLHFIISKKSIIATICLLSISGFFHSNYNYRFMIGMPLESIFLSIILLQTIYYSKTKHTELLRRIGMLSYLLYLFHEIGNTIAIKIIGTTSIPTNFFTIFPTSLVTTLVIAKSFHFVSARCITKTQW